MKQNLERWLEDLDDIEGGFANRSKSADPGGATMYGITKATLERWEKRSCTVEDVMNVTLDKARTIAGAWYWNPVQADSLPGGVDIMTADTAFHSGPAQAARLLQRSLRALGYHEVEEDGHVGPVTLAACRKADPKAVVATFAEVRLDFLKGLKNWSHNQNGWPKRVRRVQALAKLAAEPIPEIPAAKPPVKSRTVWGSALGILAGLPALIEMIAGNPALVESAARAIGLSPEAADFAIKLLAIIGPAIAIYARVDDHAKAKELQP